MSRSSKLSLALVVMALVATGSTVSYAGDAADEIESRIRAFYETWRQSQSAHSFDGIRIGSSGFLADGGMLVEIPNEAAHRQLSESYQMMFDEGLQIALTPKHIKVEVFGDAAVATFYVEGSVSAPGAPVEPVLNRATVVFVRDGKNWTMAHWHISELRSPNASR
jgi:ketosteroid isomerase-like protein